MPIILPPGTEGLLPTKTHFSFPKTRLSLLEAHSSMPAGPHCSHPGQMGSPSNGILLDLQL